MQFRFGQAAEAIGVKEAALRNWLSRNNVDLWGERPDGGWRTFTARDVLILSLAAELVSFGAKVDDAVFAVQAAVADAPGADPFELPATLYGARSVFGGWELHADKGMAKSLAGNRSVLELPALYICAQANAKMRAMEREAQQA